jgi:outer membrane protein TolC
MKSTVSLLAAAWLCCASSSLAQPAPPLTGPLTLDASLGLALANSSQVKKSKLDRQVLERRAREGRAAALPQVTANIGLDYVPVLPTQLLPGELFGQAEGTYIPAQFGQPWQLGGSVLLQQQIINESLRRGIPALNVTRGISDLLLERSEEEVVYNTATVFYQTLQTEQLLRAINANVDKLEALQRMAELQLANGYAIPTDVKRIRVARTNLETQRQNLLTGISALRQTLQFFCGLPADAPLELEAELGAPAADSARWQSLQLAPEATTEHRLLMRNLELTRIQQHSLHGESYPSLSAYVALSSQTWRNNINFFDPDRRWFGMAAVGFKLKIPVFDGFRLHHKSLIFKLELEKMEEDRRQLSGAKSLEFRQAREQLQNALRALSTQSDNVALAREITDKLLLQYKTGIAPLTDLLNAQTALSEAETNYWQQVFGYKLAVLKLLKSAGRLEELQGK